MCAHKTRFGGENIKIRFSKKNGGFFYDKAGVIYRDKITFCLHFEIVKDIVNA